MKLNYIIPRFSNFLFFSQRIDQNCGGKHQVQIYLPEEHSDVFFCGENETVVNRQLNKVIGKRKGEHLKKSLIVMRAPFKIYWETIYSHLASWKRYFQKNNVLLSRSISEIAKLNGVKNFNFSRVPIYFISVSPSEKKEVNAWFSWTPKKSFIVVEIPEKFLDTGDIFHVGVLAHEFFHLILRKSKEISLQINSITQENELLLIRLSKGMPPRLFFEELLVSSFIPEGYIGEKNFHRRNYISKSKPKDLLSWRRFVAYSLRSKSKEYVESKRIIDREYLESIMNVLQRN